MSLSPETPRRVAGIATVLSCAWIVAIAFATTRAGVIADNVVGTPFEAGGITFFLLATVFLIPGDRSDGCSGLAFTRVALACAAAALLEAGRLSVRDAGCAAMLCAAVALHPLRRPMMSALVIGLATALNPLGVLGVSWLVFTPASSGRRWAMIGLSLATAVVGAGLIGAATGSHFSDAIALQPDIARIAPHDVWRWLSRFADAAMPALALALVACGVWVSAGAGESCDETARCRASALTAWMSLAFIVACVFPRLAVAHLWPLVVPALLAAPAGWHMLRGMPISRGDWSFSTFTIVCHVLVLYLLWSPLKQAGGLMLVTVLPP